MPATHDPISQAIVAAVIISVFVLLTLEKAHRVLVIFAAVGFLWIVTYLTPYHLISFEAAHRALDLNVILLLASMMAIVGVLKTTGVFSWAVGRMVESARGIPGALQARVVWFTGILSAFMDNVTTVLFMYPMAVGMATATAIPAAVLLLPMIVASNVGGTATLIGDPPNILIGSGAGLSFMDFIVNLTMPVLWMLVAASAFSRRYYRKSLGAAAAAAAGSAPQLPPAAITNPRLLKWGLVIAGFVFIGFLTHSLTEMPAAVPAAIGAAALLLVQDVLYLRNRPPTAQERTHGILTVIEREIEWPTLAFFAFLFIAVGAAVETGLIDSLARALIGLIQSGQARLGLSETATLFFAAVLVLWVSGFLSALIDNIPYVAVTIPLVARLVTGMSGDVQVLWWALSLGACLGGNGTAIGASANVTVIGMADRSGQPISFREYTRFGASITVITLLVSTVFIASHLYLGQRLTFLIGTGAFLTYLAWKALTRSRRRPALP